MIARANYIDRIKPWVGKPVIKVLTGMRRTGKSTLLEQIAQLITASSPRLPIRKVSLDSLEWEALRSYRALHDWACSELPQGPACLLVDEIQECDGWENAINSLFATGRFDIYVTGSNARLLSSELATKIAGRYVEFPVYSLSFSEFFDFRGNDAGSRDEEFSRYLRQGGFPGLHHFDQSEHVTYLNALYDTILLRDIVQRHQVRDVHLLERIIRFAFDNIGNTISANSIAVYLKSQRLDASVQTVQAYLRHLESCYAMHRIARYDIQGKRHLEVNEKFYLGDIGLRHGLLGYRERDIGGFLENIVCLELLRRGWKVSVGKSGQREIDFVAQNAQGKRMYLQVCYLLASPATVDREFGALESIDDNYPKWVLSMDPLDQPERNGIEWRRLTDFLLDQSW